MSTDHGGPEAHRTTASVAVGVITASDTRSIADDTSGQLLADGLVGAGHAVVFRTIAREDPGEVQSKVKEAITAGARVVLVTGGTGISARDRTPEAVRELFARELPGFGEIFRVLSFQEIGAAALFSRACAGVTAEGQVLFTLPGSRNACRLALERLILPELAHLLAQASR